MSVQELRTRIVNLHTEIDLQKELLKKLERDVTLAQRQLNALLDPVARLPLEISSDIFLRSRAGARHLPGLLLLNICHAWTHIALSIPALWATIHIIFPCAEGFKDVLPIWLARAHNYPLSVWLEGKFGEEIVSIIWKHGRQLQHLEICEVAGQFTEHLWGGDTRPELLPLLETLTIRGLAKGSLGFFRNYIFELLRLAPNLVECLFHHATVYNVEATAPLVLPKLRRLVFELDLNYGMSRPAPGDAVLNYVSLPKLQALTGYVTTDNLLSFLKRSSPPILELVLLGDELPFVSLAEFVPDLRMFTTWWPKCQALEESFAVLADSPSLLPHLSTLIIHLHEGDFRDMSASFWIVPARALTARRGQLQSFQFNVPYQLPPSMMPAPDIVAAFSELAMDGTRVSISAYYETWKHTFA